MIKIHELSDEMADIKITTANLGEMLRIHEAHIKNNFHKEEITEPNKP